MGAELTLTIEKEVIAKAEAYAYQEGKSLSDLVENYLITLTVGVSKPIEEQQYPPVVQSLKGALAEFKEELMDYRPILEEELLKKYLS